MAETQLTPAKPVAGRSCGACTMCCKVLEIRELQKPIGVWCKHATPGRGCGIYETRPNVCRGFHCEWMINVALGPEWKPDACKFVMSSTPEGNISIVTDRGSPSAWRDPRYYRYIKLNAARLLDSEKVLTVIAGARTTVVLPDRDVDLGLVPPGHAVRLFYKMVDGEKVFEPKVVSAATA